MFQWIKSISVSSVFVMLLIALENHAASRFIPDNQFSGQLYLNQSILIWSPDSSWILVGTFQPSDGDGVSDLFRMRIDGSNLENLTNTPEIREDAPALSPDGQWIYYGTNDENSRFQWFRMRWDGLGKQQITGEYPPVIPLNGSLPYPHFSPDGQWIAYGSSGGVYRMRLDGSAAQRLTDITSTEDMLAWSPDGEWIAFSNDGTQHRDVYLVHPDGTGFRRIATGKYPHFSLDSQWLYFDEQHTNLYRIRVDGTQAQLVLSGPFRQLVQYENWIILQRYGASGKNGIYRMRADGSSLDHLTSTPDQEEWLLGLSPQDERILYQVENSVYRMSLDGSIQELWFEFPERVRNMRLSPDGTGAVFFSEGRLYYVPTGMAVQSQPIEISVEGEVLHSGM